MSFSYSSSLSTDKDFVRFLIHDTVEPGHAVEDEEINGILTRIPNVYLAAAAIADSLAAKYAASGEESVAIDGFSITTGDQVSQYKSLSATLRAQAAQAPGGLGVPYAGGVSKSDMETVASNSDRPPNKFVKGMMDNQLAGRIDPSDRSAT